MRAYHVSMQCEAKSRRLKETMLEPSRLKSEMLPFFFKDGEDTVTKLAPMVWLSSLNDHIMFTLDELDRYVRCITNKTHY